MRGYQSKRPVETCVAFVLAIVTLPLVVGLGLISMIAYRSWPFFVQRRVGRLGADLHVVKIRSLPKRTPPDADREQLDAVHVGPYGRFIRATHLDELPQLWQVVSGSMGLVGPRPMITSIVDRMHPVHRIERHEVRPGVTGLWQVSEYGSRLVLEAAEYDEYYITTASLQLDAWILWATVKQTFGGKPVKREALPPWITLPALVDEPTLFNT